MPRLYTYILIILINSFFIRLGNAQVSAPSQGGEVSLIRVTATSMELRFGMTGTGQGRIVMMATVTDGTSVPLPTVDGIFYSASTVYGQGSPIGKGYVVYCGAGHSTLVTGLIPNTYYYITTAEYNRDSTNVAYNTHSSSVATRTRAGSIALSSQANSTCNIEVYPNPSAGQAVQLAIYGYGDAVCILSLTNTLGEHIISQKIATEATSSTTLFTLPQNLASGAYILTIEMNNVNIINTIRKQIIITN